MMNKPMRSLRQRIYSFGGSIMLMTLLVGGLLCIAVVQSIHSYQEIMMQMTNVQQLKEQVGAVSESVRNRVVNGADNVNECMQLWTDLDDRVQQLDTIRGSTALRLLARDLQIYHKTNNAEFYSLIQADAEESIQERYQQFGVHQEDRQFLCDLLLKQLTDYMADSYDTIMRKNTVSLVVFALLLLGVLLMTGYFSMSLATDIYKPVNRLTKQALEIMEGNYQMDDLPVAQEDEIGRLTEAFNTMKNRVRENFRAREELWQVQSLLQDAEFRALQSQVNPHFLYNVLSVATEAALIEGADRTVDIIEKISYMLHYGLSSVREESWLADELKMVQSYLFLQSERFQDRITFRYEIPEEVPAIRIPGMTLQPLVENAVKHGVEHMASGGMIRLTMYRTAEVVEICVEDNGCGMPAEKVDALNHGRAVRRVQNSTGLGIGNVYGRMQAFYQQSGLLRIESREGHGTKVYIKYLV